MYDLLEGIRVLEVAVAAPDGLGAHLASMGAEVIKVEKPPFGDTTRVLADGFINLLWNRARWLARDSSRRSMSNGTRPIERRPSRAYI